MLSGSAISVGSALQAVQRDDGILGRVDVVTLALLGADWHAVADGAPVDSMDQLM